VVRLYLSQMKLKVHYHNILVWHIIFLILELNTNVISEYTLYVENKCSTFGNTNKNLMVKLPLCIACKLRGQCRYISTHSQHQH